VVRGTLIKRLAIAIVTIVAAASLAGCGTSPRPFSLEEKIWFDKAKGGEHEFVPVYPMHHYYSPPDYDPAPYRPIDSRG
jgi:hypothetical protein